LLKNDKKITWICNLKRIGIEDLERCRNKKTKNHENNPEKIKMIVKKTDTGIYVVKMKRTGKLAMN